MSECVTWTGSLDRNGYGILGNRYAHRLAYEEANGPIPSGTQIDHTCHNLDRECPGGPTCPHRACVNPAHLEAVSQQENIRRGRSICNAKRAQTHCVHGHEFTLENTWIRRNGSRVCKECRRRRLRELRRRQLEETARA